MRLHLELAEFVETATATPPCCTTEGHHPHKEPKGMLVYMWTSAKCMCAIYRTDTRGLPLVLFLPSYYSFHPDSTDSRTTRVSLHTLGHYRLATVCLSLSISCLCLSSCAREVFPTNFSFTASSRRFSFFLIPSKLIACIRATRDASLCHEFRDEVERCGVRMSQRMLRAALSDDWF